MASARKRRRLRAVRAAIVDSQGSVLRPGCGGREGNQDLAFPAWEQTFATVIGLAKLSAGLDGRDGDRVAGAELDNLRLAGCANQVRSEGQARRRKCHARGRADAGQRNRLRAAGSIIGDADGRTSISCGCGRESHADLAAIVWRQRRRAVVGLAEIAAVRSGN